MPQPHRLQEILGETLRLLPLSVTTHHQDQQESSWPCTLSWTCGYASPPSIRRLLSVAHTQVTPAIRMLTMIPMMLREIRHQHALHLLQAQFLVVHLQVRPSMLPVYSLQQLRNARWNRIAVRMRSSPDVNDLVVVLGHEVEVTELVLQHLEEVLHGPARAPILLLV